jgi:plasmid stability protein
MSATITIPTELEVKIAVRAAALGLSVEEYAREVLERDVAAPTLRELFAPVREQIKASGATDEELATQIEAAVAEVRERHRG